MNNGYFDIGEKVVIKSGDRKLEGIVKSVEYCGEMGTLYLVDYHVGNDHHVRMFHSWDLERIDEKE